MTTTCPDTRSVSAIIPDLKGPASVALEVLGSELHANQYRAVHLAAAYDDELEWLRKGLSNPALGIARRLQLHASTAREWIRIGHSLRYLPAIDAAFRDREVSYAKVRILTRWADPDNERELLQLALDRSADRLTTAIAQLLAEDEDDDARDQRHHESRGLTSFTTGDGMVVIRVVLPPASAKPLLAAVNELVGQIAQIPMEEELVSDQSADNHSVENLPVPSADGSRRRNVAEKPIASTQCGGNASADALDCPSPPSDEALRQRVNGLQRRWPTMCDRHHIPSLAQQRVDALMILFGGLNVAVRTEVVVHVRGDGNTFDDGTPITDSALARQLDGSFIRLLIHDAEQRPINASSRRRHPTTRQKRVVLEAYNHECVDCSSTDLIEFDHNPPYHQTRHTITDELEPRCAPCHRARHRSAA